MISNAKNVTDYLKDVPENRREALNRIRELCKEVLIGYEEIIAYGAPAYKKDKGIEIGFASQKKYIGFYCLVHKVMLSNQALLKEFTPGKGTIRFPRPDKIDFELIRKLLTDTVNSGEKP